MDIAELITPAGVLAALPASDKPTLLRELAQRAARSLGIDAQAILAALQARETLGSTGVGQGIGLPHTRLDGLGQFFGLFARLERPIDFDAIDERPVDLVFLLLIPPQAGGAHLAALASVSRRLRDREVAAQLRAVRSAAELYRVLTEPNGAVLP